MFKLSELKKFAVQDSKSKIPSLNEALELVNGQCLLLIEVKGNITKEYLSESNSYGASLILTPYNDENRTNAQYLYLQDWEKDATFYFRYLTDIYVYAIYEAITYNVEYYHASTNLAGYANDISDYSVIDELKDTSYGTAVFNRTYNIWQGETLVGYTFLGWDIYETKQTSGTPTVTGEYLTNYALPCGLTSDSKWLISSAQGIPLLWERKYGDGKFIVINTDGYARKTGRGILIAAVSRIHDDFIYPIIASKVIFIDDFPAPVPEGTLPSIWEEFQMSTRDFFRYVWWPDMVGFARKYDLKYTGFIIETYNNHVHGDFISDTGYTSKQFLVSYGRELLKMGGDRKNLGKLLKVMDELMQ
jgi:hypothetical protein